MQNDNRRDIGACNPPVAVSMLTSPVRI